MSDTPENIVLITVDSLRADYCGFLDGGEDLTPFLNDLASKSLVFEDAISPGPRTPSAMPSIVSGVHRAPPTQTRQDWGERWESIDAHLRTYGTVAEQLSRQGYDTVGITVNPWTVDLGFDRGFDQFYTLDDIVEESSLLTSPVWRLERFLREGKAGQYLDVVDKRQWFLQWEDYYDKIAQALDDADRPYFIWVFLLDTHQPYIVSNRFREENTSLEMFYAIVREFIARDQSSLPDHVLYRLKGAYRDAVRSIDEFIRILSRDTILDDPVMVFHADHGEAFGEHGSFGHEPVLYRENIRVPLLVNGASVPRERIREPVSLCVIPQIIEAIASGKQLTRTSLVSEFVFSASEFGETACIYGNGWKLIRSGSDRELYDISRDPGEHADLSAERPVVVEGLETLLTQSQSRLHERAAIRKAIDGMEAAL